MGSEVWSAFCGCCVSLPALSSGGSPAPDLSTVKLLASAFLCQVSSLAALSSSSELAPDCRPGISEILAWGWSETVAGYGTLGVSGELPFGGRYKAAAGEATATTVTVPVVARAGLRFHRERRRAPSEPKTAATPPPM